MSNKTRIWLYLINKSFLLLSMRRGSKRSLGGSLDGLPYVKSASEFEAMEEAGQVDYAVTGPDEWSKNKKLLEEERWKQRKITAPNLLYPIRVIDKRLLALSKNKEEQVLSIRQARPMAVALISRLDEALGAKEGIFNRSFINMEVEAHDRLIAYVDHKWKGRTWIKQKISNLGLAQRAGGSYQVRIGGQRP